MPTTLHENRPSAGIGVVEVQKPMVFSDFQHARATLCGDRRGRGAKAHGFLRFPTCPRNPLQKSAWSRCKNPWFLRFLRCSRNPLPESARSRCKNSRFFAISAVLAQLPESAWSSCKNSRFFATFVVRTGPRELSRGSRACSRNRRVPGSIPPWSAGGRRKMQLACESNLRRATCADQLAPTSLRRAPCLEQLAQSNLRRATCAEQLAQSSLHRATCRERKMHRANCREPLAGTNLPEQLARSNLRRATCTVQLA